MKEKSNYSVFWTHIAKIDLSEIIEYIAQVNINAATKTLLKIEDLGNSLNSCPKKGRIVPELKKYNIIKYRELIFNPWRIIYKIEKNNVYVMAVIDGRRNLEDILLNRLLNR